MLWFGLNLYFICVCVYHVFVSKYEIHVTIHVTVFCIETCYFVLQDGARSSVFTVCVAFVRHN